MMTRMERFTPCLEKIDEGGLAGSWMAFNQAAAHGLRFASPVRPLPVGGEKRNKAISNDIVSGGNQYGRRGPNTPCGVLE